MNETNKTTCGAKSADEEDSPYQSSHGTRIGCAIYVLAALVSVCIFAAALLG